MTGYLQVSTTADSHETAMNLLRSAVRAKLAASGQVFGPASSVFWHEGELGEGEEWQIFLKTTTERYPELEAHLIAEHTWSKPEVTFTTIDGGSAPYLEWLRKTTA
ncbi:divalent-cation tolerance protein CutA [Streptosporangium carneum]|uniref:Divalent-cation tolerance protein CutA n=1 Tax=Streptosporangium carneum TaxID=47481 RepID=A0A9W6HYA4_9ACTN|nr:divalent cation tolerance protein CutA [Streptosporangium carneum]GLK07823.1 divalent-cation tolerance protein CutA [Streptosporangium carneum]